MSDPDRLQRSERRERSNNVPRTGSRVTIVIPSYRGADTVERAVNSALNQNGGNVSVVVVIDDGCELTRRKLIDLADDRITIILNAQNSGAPASRNRGLELVATAYVSFLDADDLFEGNLLGPLISEMKKCHADIGFGPSVTFSRQRGFGPVRIPQYRDHIHVFSDWLGKRKNVNTASVVWSTEYVRRIGGWDLNIERNQDGEIALRAILMGAKFATSDQGAGVWMNDGRFPRITTRNDNIGSLLYVVDKFLNMRSPIVPDEVRMRVCARYCLTIAHLAFSNGIDDIGRQALQRRRALGVANYEADWRYVLSASMRVLPTKTRLGLWRVIKSLRRLRA